MYPNCGFLTVCHVYHYHFPGNGKHTTYKKWWWLGMVCLWHCLATTNPDEGLSIRCWRFDYPFLKRQRCWSKYQRWPNGGFLSHRGTPSHHPILVGCSLINAPFLGSPIFGNPQMVLSHHIPYNVVLMLTAVLSIMIWSSVHLHVHFSCSKPALSGTGAKNPHNGHFIEKHLACFQRNLNSLKLIHSSKLT